MSDDAIGSLLRTSWEYEKQGPLEILGWISRTITKLGKTIYLLTDLRNPKNGAVLRNPYDRPGLRLGVFVRRSEVDRLSVTFAEDPWVKALAALSPQEEREKQGNSLALTAVSGTLRVPAALPGGSRRTKRSSSSRPVSKESRRVALRIAGCDSDAFR